MPLNGDLFITGRAEADDLLNTDALAVMIGMLLDQQVPMEWAFIGPCTLRERLGYLDVGRIADLDEADLVALCCAKPAIHRFPAVMGRRIYAMCRAIADGYESRADLIWEGADDGNQLYQRLRALPGFGDEKAMIFIALLAKRFHIRPVGWAQAAGVFADDVPRSIADCHDPESLARVREWKRAQRAARKDKQDRPLAQGTD